MIIHNGPEGSVSLPLPLFLVVEDVGWWQGEDGSVRQQPFRNRFPRRHCLADYQALVRLSKRLGMRIAIAMVLGEWDTTNLLKEVTGATWMGRNWDNRRNQGPWLAEAADYLRGHRDHLEIALHGLCHEFWQDGIMQRSEFHDDSGRMRPRDVVAQHLTACRRILEQHGFSSFPRLYVPPALNHSFGDGAMSMQAILRTFGIDFVTTRFARARQHRAPIHEAITGECGVILLERGRSPLAWDQSATVPASLPAQPIVALHWSNLLHPDAARSGEIVDRWAALVRATADDFLRMVAEDAADCWNQAAYYYLAACRAGDGGVIIDLHRLARLAPRRAPLTLKIRQPGATPWQCRGARVVAARTETDGTQIVRLLPETGQRLVCLQFNRPDC
jgi:hypothetical protein